MRTLLCFAALFSKEDYFRYFLFTSLGIETPPERGLLIKERFCSKKVDHLENER